MTKRLEDLILLEDALAELKNKMEYTFNVMRNINVEGMNKKIKECTKEEIVKMKYLNKLLDEIDTYWNKTIL